MIIIKVIIPTHLLNKLTDDMIKDICILSCNNDKYEVIEDKRGYNTGQYIKLLDNNITKYICLSGEDSTISRNSFILQNFPTAYMKYLEDNSTNKNFEYYIRDTKNTHPLYTIFAYKILLTCDIKILNLDRVKPSKNVDYLEHRTPFIDIRQMRKCRLDMQDRNSSNNSTLFEITDNNEISVYGKTYGANGRETTAICLALHKLEPNLPIIVYNVNETDPSHLASIDPSNKYILEYIKVKVDKNTMDFSNKNKDVVAKRNAKLYHYNLLKKFKEKKCYLCDCDIENLIQGAHIYGVAEIKKSSIKEEEKQQIIVDGDNGFWLCENHHKLFDRNLIYFRNKDLIINKSLLSYNQIEYIEESIYDWPKIYEAFSNNKEFSKISKNSNRKFVIKEEHYTENTAMYINKRNEIWDNK